ncbi:hypothetical protein Halar_1956 [halophilic archaeon DL31]|nr:hypothetical protein Halar_1956 [halophilic archaeon DL31]
MWTPPNSAASDVPNRFADNGFFRALAAQPRRRTLAYLLSTEQCSVDDLVDVLCGWETVDTRMVSPDRAEQLDIELIHVHLPALEQAGLIDYDSAGREVALKPLAESVKRLIQQSVEAEHA